MTKRRIQLPDGRYLIFYTFAPAPARISRDLEIEAEARPSGRDGEEEKRALPDGQAAEEN
ncbi:MAG TPA: hypothetical protein VIW64_06680 [Pyrinomonadaceae bacterium]|jgi:hypothetical protein